MLGKFASKFDDNLPYTYKDISAHVQKRVLKIGFRNVLVYLYIKGYN